MPELIGVIVHISPIESVGASNYQKSTLVIEYAENPDYPQEIPFEFGGDKADLPHAYAEGQEVEVSFNYAGRGWDDPKKGKRVWFGSLRGWNIKPVLEPGSAKPQYAPPADIPNDDDGDDLPF